MGREERGGDSSLRGKEKEDMTEGDCMNPMKY